MSIDTYIYNYIYTCRWWWNHHLSGVQIGWPLARLGQSPSRPPDSILYQWNLVLKPLVMVSKRQARRCWILLNRAYLDNMHTEYIYIYWLVVWNIFYFPNSWDDDPIWLIFFRGLKPPISIHMCWLLWFLAINEAFESFHFCFSITRGTHSQSEINKHYKLRFVNCQKSADCPKKWKL